MSGSGSSQQREVLTNQKCHSPALPAAPDELPLTLLGSFLGFVKK